MAAGTKAEGYVEIKDKHGSLLVAFNSADAETYWGNEYQRERIQYCMRHRRDKVPMSLRTGQRTLRLRLFGTRLEANRLHRKNQKEAN